MPSLWHDTHSANFLPTLSKCAAVFGGPAGTRWVLKRATMRHIHPELAFSCACTTNADKRQVRECTHLGFMACACSCTSASWLNGHAGQCLLQVIMSCNRNPLRPYPAEFFALEHTIGLLQLAYVSLDDHAARWLAHAMLSCILCIALTLSMCSVVPTGVPGHGQQLAGMETWVW